MTRDDMVSNLRDKTHMGRLARSEVSDVLDHLESMGFAMAEPKDEPAPEVKKIEFMPAVKGGDSVA